MTTHFKKIIFTGLALLCAAPSTGWALELEHVVGRWNHKHTGDNIRVLPNKDVEDSALGTGRLQMGVVEHGANALIVYQNNIQCWYYMTMTHGGEQMNLKPVYLERSDGRCLKGLFDRAAE